MEIKSNASPDEEFSSFYKVNQAFCLDIENYIAGKGGTIEGVFNAWSYDVIGEIFMNKKWNLKYKKATFSSSGNLFLSSKYQSLLVLSEWKTEIKEILDFEFLIRKKTLLDSIKIIFGKSTKELKPNSMYMLKQKGNNSDLIPKLYHSLKSLFNSGEVFQVAYKNNILKIELRTENHYLDVFEKLAQKL